MVKDRKQGGAEGLAQAGREKQRTRRAPEAKALEKARGAAGEEGAVPASKNNRKR